MTDTVKIKAFELALTHYASSPSTSTSFKNLAAVLAPGLFKGESTFFDQACAHALKIRKGALFPALLRFMDQLTGAGDIQNKEQGNVIEWRSACLLLELFTEEDGDDPAVVSGFESLRRTLAALHGVPEASISIAPLALDLRSARAGFDLFRFAMLPTQMDSIEISALQAANPTIESSPSRFVPWRALCYSCAFDSSEAPAYADFLSVLRQSLAPSPMEEALTYLSLSGKVREARACISLACGPFSVCTMAFEPERAQIEADLARIALAYGPRVHTLRAIIELQSNTQPTTSVDKSLPPPESFALTICDTDGVIIDALETPPSHECLSLVHSLTGKVGIPVIVAPPAATHHNHKGERLWASQAGYVEFDIFMWRARVLGTLDTP